MSKIVKKKKIIDHAQNIVSQSANLLEEAHFFSQHSFKLLYSVILFF